MPNTDFFEWFVNYHCSVNLERCLPHTDKGCFVSPFSNTIYGEGEENEAYSGVILISNGNTLVDKLIEKGVVKKRDIGDFHPCTVQEQLFGFLDTEKKKDGGYLYDSQNREIARVYKVNNSLGLKERPLTDFLPSDFVSYNRSIPVNEENIGLKTRLAIDLSQAIPGINVFQIKRSAYTPLSMGKVIHINDQGLVKEFFLRYDPCNEGPFIRPDEGVVGIKREYRREGKELRRVSERLVDGSKTHNLSYCHSQ